MNRTRHRLLPWTFGLIACLVTPGSARALAQEAGVEEPSLQDAGESPAPWGIPEPGVEQEPSSQEIPPPEDSQTTLSAPPEERPGTPATGPASPAMVPHDLDPGFRVGREGDRSLSLGASVQLMAAPYVGGDSLVANGDAANEEGFRLRRVRLGVAGDLRRDVTFHLTLNPLGQADALVHASRLTWHLMPALAVSLGTGKVPYARSATESSGRLHFVDRPLGTGEVAIGQRLGLTVEGALLGDLLRYVAGVYNASDTYAVGNQSGGLLLAARLESAPLGQPAAVCPDALRLQLGIGAVREDGPTVDTVAMSADVHVEVSRVRLRGEVLMDTRRPDAEPILSPTLPDEVKRLVWLAEATGFLIRDRLELGVRYEWYDDNRGYEDFGDQQIVTAGVSYYLQGHGAKAQLNYIHRDERAGIELDNDALVLSVQGAL